MEAETTEPQAAESAGGSAAPEDEVALVARLPFEILAAILAQIAIDSPRAFLRTQLIGHALRIPYDSALLWEPICRQTYPEVASGLVDADDYGGYYQLFRTRPTVRHNGVYLCRSRYFRDAEPDGISFHRRRIEVLYYRYLWLDGSGGARSLLSNHEPRQVLGLDGAGPPAPALLRDVMPGHWRLDPESKRLSITVDGGLRRKSDFHLDLEVASSGGKVHNKLKWRRYWMEAHGTASTSEVGMQNEGSYYFCVLSSGVPGPAAPAGGTS